MIWRIVVLLCLFSCSVMGQATLSGHFPVFAGKSIYLVGFDGFNEWLIDSTVVSADGTFDLKYTSKPSMALLSVDERNSCILALGDEAIHLNGADLADVQHFNVINGIETQKVHQFLSEFGERTQALNGWYYMRKMYQNEKSHLHNVEAIASMSAEIERLTDLENTFFRSIAEYEFTYHYLHMRRLIHSVMPVLEFRFGEAPNLLQEYRTIDYADDKLWKSGLLSDMIQSHFYLLENMGGSIQQVYEEMTHSIDLILDQLSHNSPRFNAATNHLFLYLEQRNLFRASEYLALRILDMESCSVDSDFAKQLEFYRKLQIGNKAPDFVFTGDVYRNGTWSSTTFNLKDVKTNYKILVFGASWCPKCVNELQEIIAHYPQWKTYGAELVFVSLDDEPELFKNFVRDIPGISLCDYAQWEGVSVKNYHVFATPTIFLLDANHNILLRPFSVYQLNTWFELNAK